MGVICLVTDMSPAEKMEPATMLDNPIPKPAPPMGSTSMAMAAALAGAGTTLGPQPAASNLAITPGSRLGSIGNGYAPVGGRRYDEDVKINLVKVVVLGAPGVGKTSIVKVSFDQFWPILSNFFPFFYLYLTNYDQKKMKKKYFDHKRNCSFFIIDFESTNYLTLSALENDVSH